MTKDPLGLLGLAAKAGAVKSGGFLTEKAIKEGEAYIVIVAQDASDGTKKKLCDKCKFYQVPCYEYGTMDELGHRVGREARSSLAITDEGFAKQTEKRFGMEIQEGD